MNLPIALGMPGWPEMIVLGLLIILLFGAKKLPALARGLGQSLGEFKKGRAEGSAPSALSELPPAEKREAAGQEPDRKT